MGIAPVLPLAFPLFLFSDSDLHHFHQMPEYPLSVNIVDGDTSNAYIVMSFSFSTPPAQPASPPPPRLALSDALPPAAAARFSLPTAPPDNDCAFTGLVCLLHRLSTDEHQ